jgi:hypothetical protein
MKKHDVVEKLDRAGEKISGLHANAWNVALNPTHNGWASSIFSAATIPILSAASIGQMVGAAIVKQINPDTFERLTGESPRDKGEQK